MKRTALFLSSFVIVLGLAAVIYLGVSPYHEGLRQNFSGAAISQSLKIESIHFKAMSSGKKAGANEMKLSRDAFLGDNGVAKDEQLGAYWAEKAAEKDTPHARGLIGVLYLGGIGVPQSFENAQKWLALSEDAEAKQLAAQLNAMNDAVSKMPAEQRAQQEKTNADSAMADVRKSFSAILDDMKKHADDEDDDKADAGDAAAEPAPAAANTAAPAPSAVPAPAAPADEGAAAPITDAAPQTPPDDTKSDDTKADDKSGE